ncbi:hypothetical protein SIID45300_00509 [Candidatus Magnetaquicoccaceae bacterium FCR-1]|uniref:ABC transporter substrate-binding protein n=1 Tax=Candidatus Magnetaquiglobus chichijimensis TaxID=3141448 RepID=A0ABQ0C5Q2_9PROT
MDERRIASWIGLLFVLLAFLVPFQPPLHASGKHRILIISSYHREYLWSQDTQRGVHHGLLELGYFDQQAQIARFLREDRVETSRAVLRKLWMDTKRKSAPDEMVASARRVLEEAEAFAPDLLLLGDDNAARLIGSHYLDTPIPVVFWGINIWPLKYGLLDSIAHPGHNVTGIYQPGYMREGLEFLLRLVPGIRTLGVLADDSETSLAKIKELHRLEETGKLPVKLGGTVVTNDETAWKKGALALAAQVDAIYLTNHNTIRDATGRPIDQLALGAWYLRNIAKPDIGDEKQFVEEGVLCVADDSGYKQGYEAVRMAHRILAEGMDPATMPPVAPSRGALIVNRTRARQLGIEGRLKSQPGIEEFIDRSVALDRHPVAP